MVPGDRVVLRPLRAGEFDVVWSAHAARRAPVGSWDEDDEDARKRLRRRIEQSGSMTKHELLFGIESEGDLIGEIQGRISAEALPPGVVELGVELYDGSRRGDGLGSDAIALMTSHLFERAEAHRVQAATDVDNRAMRAALEHLGFREEGVLRRFMPDERGPRDYAMYALTQEDWEEASVTWTRTS